MTVMNEVMVKGTKTREQIEQEGRDAADQGKGAGDNPYPFSEGEFDDAYHWWLSGWEMAEYEEFGPAVEAFQKSLVNPFEKGTKEHERWQRAREAVSRISNGYYDPEAQAMEA